MFSNFFHFFSQELENKYLENKFQCSHAQVDEPFCCLWVFYWTHLLVVSRKFMSAINLLKIINCLECFLFSFSKRSQKNGAFLVSSKCHICRVPRTAQHGVLSSSGLVNRLWPEMSSMVFWYLFIFFRPCLHTLSISIRTWTLGIFWHAACIYILKDGCNVSRKCEQTRWRSLCIRIGYREMTREGTSTLAESCRVT